MAGVVDPHIARYTTVTVKIEHQHDTHPSVYCGRYNVNKNNVNFLVGVGLVCGSEFHFHPEYVEWGEGGLQWCREAFGMLEHQ